MLPRNGLLPSPARRRLRGRPLRYGLGIFSLGLYGDITVRRAVAQIHCRQRQSSHELCSGDIARSEPMNTYVLHARFSSPHLHSHSSRKVCRAIASTATKRAQRL